MEEFRSTYVRLCKDAGVEPSESVVAQLHHGNAAHSSTLNLSGLSLPVETCSVLAKALQKDLGFTEVSLSDCMLSEEGAKVLLTGLSGNKSVKVLDLKGNNLKTGGAVLGTLLSCNTSIRRLGLEWNALGVWDEAFSHFCDGLASNSVLTHLDLRNNQINHQGASELALALKRNSTLEVLDLRWNNIGLLGGRSLLDALQKNKGIVQLELSGNEIPSDTLKALELSAVQNSVRHTHARESQRKTQVLSKEIQSLKDKKRQQVLSLYETIDRQQEEMRGSSRSASIQIGQLQEALNERNTAVNALTAKLQMTEAALSLSEEKIHKMGKLLSQAKSEKDEQLDQLMRARKKEQEGEEMERRCKSQQQQIFELKHDLTNSTAELKLRLVQAEDHLETEKRRFKQALEDVDILRQKEVDHVNCQLQETERALNERIFKMEAQRIQLEEELSKVKAQVVTERTQAMEELGRVRVQIRLEEQDHMSSFEAKLSSVQSSLQEALLQNSQQRQTISELQAKNTQQSSEMDRLRHRIEELQQDLLGKDQEKVAEVNRVRIELLEQIGHLEAEKVTQGGLKEKISALEREIKVLNSSHREALQDKESEVSSLMEKLRVKKADIQRMREDEALRASSLQRAIFTYIQGSPLENHGRMKK